MRNRNAAITRVSCENPPAMVFIRKGASTKTAAAMLKPTIPMKFRPTLNISEGANDLRCSWKTGITIAPTIVANSMANITGITRAIL